MVKSDSQEIIVETKRLEIRSAMRSLGRAIQGGDDRELLHWVIPRVLAVVHRPLRYHPLYGGSRLPLPEDASPLIEEWADLLQVEGVRSIISLMHDGDVACYRKLSIGNGDLLTYLQDRGFFIARHPYEDPAHKSVRPSEARLRLHRIREEALESFDRLPKPVLITCSAGQDRSAPVAAYLYAHRDGPSERLKSSPRDAT